MTDLITSKINKEILNEMPLCSPKVFEIKPGLNSSAYKLVDKKKILFLKIYKDNVDNMRLTREDYLLRLSEKLGIENTPKIVKTSKKLSYCAMSWIEGKTIDSPTLSDWREQINFIHRLQKGKDAKQKDTAILAADAFFTLEEHREKAESRLQQSLVSLKECNYNQSSKYTKPITLFSNNLFRMTEHALKRQAKSIRSELIVMSPSDIGFHNILRTKTGCVFFDFEYSGLDDMYKLLADWCIHPDWRPPAKLTPIFLNWILTEKERRKFDPKRAIAMLYIYQMKWIAIIIDSQKKKTFETEDDLAYFKKALNYISKITEHANEYAKILKQYPHN